MKIQEIHLNPGIVLNIWPQNQEHSWQKLLFLDKLSLCNFLIPFLNPDVNETCYSSLTHSCVMTRSSGMCGTENWVRKRKFLFLLCSFFRSFTELCLLCLPKWAGCQWSKTRGWEGDGKCPGKGKAPLLTWPCWKVHGVVLKSHVPRWPLSSHYFSAELKAYRTFFRGKSVHTDSPCHKQLGHFTFASFSTWRCSSPENCILTLEMWDKPVKFQEDSGRLF